MECATSHTIFSYLCKLKPLVRVSLPRKVITLGLQLRLVMFVQEFEEQFFCIFSIVIKHDFYRPLMLAF